MNLMGLGGVLTFNAGNSLSVLGGLSGAFQGMSRSAGGASMALKGVGLAMAPVALLLTHGFNMATKFEHQMRAVQSAVIHLSDEKLGLMSRKAQALGRTTQFSATEVGEAMEKLGRAGFKMEEIQAAISGVLNTAAAGAMDPVAAAEITSTIMRSMGLQANQADHISDVLTVTAHRTNTTIQSLGESFSYGAAGARTLNMTLEQTAAMFGKLGDVALKGSIGGTTGAQMMMHAILPGKKKDALLAAWHVNIREIIKLTPEDVAAGKSAATKLIEAIGGHLKGLDLKSKMDATHAVFGVRGMKGAAALIDAVPGMQALTKELMGSAGAAKEIAEIRLNSFVGQLKIAEAAVEGFWIQFSTPFLKPAADALREVSAAIGDVDNAIQLIKDYLGPSGWHDIAGPPTEDMESQRRIWVSLSDNVKNFGMGIKVAIDNVIEGYSELSAWGHNLFGMILGDNPGENLQLLGRAATYFVLLAPILTTLGAVVLGIGIGINYILIPAITFVIALFSGLVEAIVPVIVIGGALYALFSLLGNDQESFGETALRVWNTVSTAVLDFVSGLQQSQIMTIMSAVSEAWSGAIDAIKFMFSELFGGLTVDWQTIGMTVGNVIAAVLVAVVEFVGFVIKYGALAVTTIGSFFEWLENTGQRFFATLIARFTLFGEIVKTVYEIWTTGVGWEKLGNKIYEFVVSPFRAVLEIVLDVVRGIEHMAGITKTSIPKGVAEWAHKAQETISSKSGVPGAPGYNPMDPKTLALQGGSKREGGDLFVGPARPVEDDHSLGGILKRLVARSHQALLPPNLYVSPQVTTKVELDHTTNITADGKILSTTIEKHRTEIGERSGFKGTPWQRSAAIDFGFGSARGFE